MKKPKVKKWIEYDIYITVMQIYMGEYEICSAQSVQILKASLPESNKILTKNSETVVIKQVLN